MNPKKMSDEELFSTIEAYIKTDIPGYELNSAELEYLNACKRELRKRWGIKN